MRIRKHTAPPPNPYLVEALGLVDVALERTRGRAQMSGAEITDLLLDLRSSLIESCELAHAMNSGVPVLQD
jgi:hypothetical protein